MTEMRRARLAGKVVSPNVLRHDGLNRPQLDKGTD
jgi:hypothetical protein